MGDGSVEAVAGNAAFLALLDAGISMRATALCVSIGVHAASIGDGHLDDVLLLDPTELEEKDSDAVVTVCIDSTSNQLVSSLSKGEALDAVAWASCVDAGTKACRVLEAFMRMSLQKRLE